MHNFARKVINFFVIQYEEIIIKSAQKLSQIFKR